MKNKQTFELPNYLSPEMNNYEIFLKKIREIKEHLEILEEQKFCLNLERFFNIYPNIEEITLTSRREGGFLDIIHSFKGEAQCVTHFNIPINNHDNDIKIKF